jgi:hypothetical protein
MNKEKSKPQQVALPEQITYAVLEFNAMQARVQSLIQGFIFGCPECEKQTVYDVTPDGKFLVKRQD